MVWLYVIGYVVMGVLSVKFALWCVKNTYNEKERDSLKNDQSERVAFLVCNFAFWWFMIPAHAVYNHAFNLGRKLNK